MMSRIRWWLARRLAPVQIMAVPFVPSKGETTAAIVYWNHEGWSAAWRIDRLRLKSTTRLPKLDYDRFEPTAFGISRTFTRFVGTVAR